MVSHKLMLRFRAQVSLVDSAAELVREGQVSQSSMKRRGNNIYVGVQLENLNIVRTKEHSALFKTILLNRIEYSCRKSVSIT